MHRLSVSMSHPIRIGTAGWTIPRIWRDRFPPDGSQLERYAARLFCVEINSSFYRPHRAETYRRWADSVGPDFRFSVKLPKEITHQRRLIDVDRPLQAFAAQIAGLGDKLAVVLIQFPPSLALEPDVAAPFLKAAAAALPAQLVLEPRHPSWFVESADSLLAAQHVARVAADPSLVPEAAVPGGRPGFAYFRLHGSPHIYRSNYEAKAIGGHADLALRAAERAETWVIYDNTTSGAATGNALALADRVERGGA
jgi:uncharacterized protein YecE (DUF72 family)